MPELATTPPPGDAGARLRATPPRRRVRRLPGAELAESPPPEERDREERE